MFSEILSLTNEAAVVIKSGRIVYANQGALSALGDSCLGKSVAEIFGVEVAETQAPSFIASSSIKGKRHIVRVSKVEDCRIILFSPPAAEAELINDPFIYFMRSSIMNIGLCADKLRELAENTGNSELMQGLSALTRNYYRMARVTNNASVVREMLGGRLTCASEELDLSQLCAELAETAELFPLDAKLRLELPESAVLLGDRNRLRQLILNLISNSLVHGHAKAVRLELLDAGESIVLSLSDNGVGIDPEALGIVFDRYRHGYDMSSLSAGIGLGLTVARGVAEAHGGALLLESRPGFGTTVRVSLKKRLCARPRFSSLSVGNGGSVKEILAGLADCLPPEAFCTEYLD